MGKKILVVDDEPDILKGVVFRLEKSGYDVIMAEDGEEALERVKEQMPDLIVLDLRLPGKDGFEVCEELKSDERYKTIPVILLTASSGIDEERLRSCKHDAFVLKPFQAEELLEKVKNFISD